MRLTSIRLVTAVALAAAITTGACSTPNSQSSGTGGTPGSGGSTGSGGSSTGSGGSNCPGGSPCGGSLVGTWTVSSSCLNLSGDMDVSLASLGCSTVPVSGSFHVTGTWTANADETYTDNTVTTGSITFPLAPSCLSVSSVQVACNKVAGSIQALGWASVTCSNDSSGNCSCSATANQNGGIGIVSPYAATSGNYTTSGSGLKVDDKVDYSYCASGSTLTLIPNTAGTAISGTIVLQKGGSGSGGSTGSGGSVASGGTTGSGGNTASGGTTGSGGNTASGGNTGSGGKGGATGSGGSAGSGGNTASGGTTGKGGGGGATGSGGSAGAAGASASGGATGTGGSSSGGMGPCDIYAAANTPCVAAHSTVRSLLGSYTGALYQVKRASDGTKKDIGIVGGLADSATQDTFCAGTTCTITLVYDQSGHGNLVEAETPDSTVGGHTGMTASNATQESLTLNGHKVYSLYMKTAQAYWRDGSKSGMPLGSSPQGIYMVTSGKHFGSGCCFDYGNGETSRMYVAGPSMDAVNFSNCTIWGTGAGTGPWVMADLEGGLYAKGGSGQSTADPSLTYTYVTAMEKNNGTGTFALKGGDASTGAISTFYSGSVPPGYNPAKKQGSIVLGSGGDCCYSNNTASQGTFYEGAIVAGYPSDATDTAIQANIVMAGYGK